jgi:hypothetical protein
MEILKRKYGDYLMTKGHHATTDGAQKMKKFLDLLDYSRAGKSTDEKSVDLNEVMIDYKALRKIKNKVVTIDSKKLPVILSYKAPVIQIFHCLLDKCY